jgi:hypothetical protein
MVIKDQILKILVHGLLMKNFADMYHQFQDQTMVKYIVGMVQQTHG